MIALLAATDWFVLGYYAVLSTLYLGLLVVAGRTLHERSLVNDAAEQQAMLATLDERLPGVTVIAPAHNEEAGIVDSVRSLLALVHPNLQVVVVNDGSKDSTVAVLRAAFALEERTTVYVHHVPTQRVRAIYGSPLDHRLVVVDKENGGKADALNCGANLASQPLLCAIDADSVLERDALARACIPYRDDPERVVAVGGVIRPVNGCDVDRGHVQRVGLPSGIIARLQVVEYARAFLAGRTAWARLGGLLIISGAFGVFQRDLVREVGGWDTTTVGEDGELVVRMHRRMREQRRPYVVAFVPEPVCWTEVPEQLDVLRSQRTRWHRGLAQLLWIHRRMIGNPRYGIIGTVAMPFALVFELLGPVIEAAGLVLVPLGFATGAVNLPFLIAFTLMAVLFGILQSMACILLDEGTLRRQPRTRDVLNLMWCSAVENVGYRQLNALWRVQGIWQFLRGTGGWGEMRRAGLDRSTIEDAPVTVAPHVELAGAGAAHAARPEPADDLAA